MEAGEALLAGRRPLMAWARRGAAGEEQDFRAVASAAACGSLVSFSVFCTSFLCPPSTPPPQALSSLWRVWSTCPVRSRCGSWGCLACRKEAQGGTLLLFAALFAAVAGGGRSLFPGNQELERGHGHRLRQGRFRLSARRDLSSERRVGYWK